MTVGGEGAEECAGEADAAADAAAEGLGLWLVEIETGGWPQAASNAAIDANHAALRISRGQL